MIARTTDNSRFRLSVEAPFTRDYDICGWHDFQCLHHLTNRFSPGGYRRIPGDERESVPPAAPTGSTGLCGPAANRPGEFRRSSRNVLAEGLQPMPHPRLWAAHIHCCYHPAGEVGDRRGCPDNAGLEFLI